MKQFLAYIMKKLNQILEKNWIVGFIDGDGYFGLEKVVVKTNQNRRVYYKPVLSITQKDPKVLYKIKRTLLVGSVKSRKTDGYFHYRVRSKQLWSKNIIPFFNELTFHTNKQTQFNLLKKAVLFLETRYDSLNEQHEQFLDNLTHQMRESKILYNSTLDIDLAWFVGFFEAEGCFYIGISNNNVKFQFKITQANPILLEKIKNFLNCGNIFLERPGIYSYDISKRDDIFEKIVPIFQQVKLKSSKKWEYVKWLKALRLVKNKRRLTEEEFNKIVKIKQHFRKLDLKI
uniref:hypothetical protein n=1 Tax=Symbiochloris sp. SG-2018 TaxID=2126034 RepID=UPI002114514C|nr:hypothetical protein NRL16_pgp034 [Symbiochloris sp. SG-2018]UTQ75736.1 hypothetical protein [Symbiochloris sp. SG-2018]